MSVGGADLDDGPLFNEQAGDLDGFFERATPVAAQVQDHAGDAFLGEFFEQLGNVGRGRTRRGTQLRRLGAAFAALAAPVNGGVEGRQINHAQAQRPAGRIGQLDESALDLLVFEFDLVADERDHAPFGGIVGGNDRQAHFSALGAADQLDGFVEIHAHDVHRRAVALGHGDNPVADLDLFAFHRRAGFEFLDLAIAVQVGRQHRADAKEREVHADSEVFGRAGVHVIGMRVVHMRQGREITLQHLVGIPFLEHVQHPVIAAREQIGDFFGVGLGLARGRRLCAGLRSRRGGGGSGCGRSGRRRNGCLVGGRAEGGPVCRAGSGGVGFGRRAAGELVGFGTRFDSGELFLEIFETQPFAPEPAGFLQVARIRCFAAIRQDALLAAEIERIGLEQQIGVGDALGEPFQKPVEDLVRRGGVGHALARDRQVIQLGAIAFELGQVLLGKVQMLRIEHFQITIEESRRKLVVERVLPIMRPFQQAGHDKGDASVTGPGSEPVGEGNCRRRARGGRQRRSGGRRRCGGRIGAPGGPQREHRGERQYRHGQQAGPFAQHRVHPTHRRRALTEYSASRSGLKILKINPPASDRRPGAAVIAFGGRCFIMAAP